MSFVVKKQTYDDGTGRINVFLDNGHLFLLSQFMKDGPALDELLVHVESIMNAYVAAERKAKEPKSEAPAADGFDFDRYNGVVKAEPVRRRR